MEYRQEISGWRIWPAKQLLAGGISVLLLAGCADGKMAPDTSTNLPQSEASTGFDGPESNQLPTTVEQPAIAELPATTELPATIDQFGTADIRQYPLDDEGDDPAGMIVTSFDEPGSSRAVSPWLASVRLFRKDSGNSNLGDVTTELTRYAEDFPVSAHIHFFSEPLDTCAIRDGEYDRDQTNPPPPTIDGGEALVLNMPSGPWLTLEPTGAIDGQLGYRAPDQLQGNLPESTTLSIPGGDFPTVAAYPLFETEPVVRVLPALEQAVTEESRFSWIPFNLKTHVKMDFIAHDEEGSFQGFPASCWVKDDGAFDLPEAVRETLESLRLQRDPVLQLNVRYSRVYSRVDLINGIVFHQRMEIAE